VLASSTQAEATSAMEADPGKVAPNDLHEGGVT
jgi:hypothetical protein